MKKLQVATRLKWLILEVEAKLMLKTPQKLQQMVEAIHASVAVVEQHDDEFIILACNERFKEMLGETPPLTPYCSLNTILVTSVANTLMRFLPEVFNTDEPIELEQAFERGQKSKWWRLFLKPMAQPQGHQKRVMITGINMDDKIAIESEINKTGARYSSVVKGAFDAIITMDRYQTINYFNRAAEIIFGYRAEEIIGKPITSLMPIRHRDNHSQYVEEFNNEQVSSRDMGERIQIYGLKKSGAEFAAEISISKIVVEGDTEFTAIIRDVSQRTQLLDELKFKLNTDYLTGLRNRNYLDHKLISMSNRFKRYGFRFSLLMIDLDHFKQINDTYGHMVGDQILKCFADAATGLLREGDKIARFGGEEFTVILPGTELYAAKLTANRLCHHISEQEFIGPNEEQIPFTISIGVVEFEPEDDVKSIMNRADEALYKAKVGGRNRVSD